MPIELIEKENYKFSKTMEGFKSMKKSIKIISGEEVALQPPL